MRAAVWVVEGTGGEKESGWGERERGEGRGERQMKWGEGERCGERK